VPQRGGQRPHLTVLIRLEDLEDRARSAVLDFGGTLSPESLRLLACDARVIPVVMNGDGQPLDVGRSNRRPRRAAPGRGRPRPRLRTPRTTLDNLVMLCRAHHRLLHRSEWTVRIRDGLPEFIPPVWMDLTGTPRRKPLTHLVAEPGFAACVGLVG
jgi:hypothetical protein